MKIIFKIDLLKQINKNEYEKINFSIYGSHHRLIKL
jgi:hypothetical protein